MSTYFAMDSLPIDGCMTCGNNQFVPADGFAYPVCSACLAYLDSLETRDRLAIVVELGRTYYAAKVQNDTADLLKSMRTLIKMGITPDHTVPGKN